jgi:dihydrofolate reductase
VLTRSATFDAPPEVLKFSELTAAIDHCRAKRESLVFVIGGSKVYEAALPIADRLYVTQVHRSVPGDTKFPAYDRSAWKETVREDGAEYSFVEYARATSLSG